MKMGKAKPSKKSSKQVRKENRLQYGNRRNVSKLASSRHQETPIYQFMDSSDDEGEHLAPGSDSGPSLSHSLWTLRNSSISDIISEDLGVRPLPIENETSSKRRSFPTASTSSEGLGVAFSHPGVTVRPSGSGAKRYLVASDPAPRAPTFSSTPVLPRVLVNSQRENRPENPLDSVYGIHGLLTPPRSLDLKPPPQLHQFGPDYFDSVPDEVILHIFYFMKRMFLVKCMQVCKKWYRICCDESLWRRVDLGEKKVQTKVLRNLFIRGTTHLRLADAKLLGDGIPGLNSKFSLEPRMSRLQFLDLSMASVSERLLEDIFCHCRQLRKVSLESVSVTDAILHLLSENSQLETLNLALCRGLTTTGLMPIFAHCLQLKQLNLAWTGMERSCVSYVCSSVPEGIRRLDISGCRDNLTDEDVSRLCARCKGMVELDLSDAGQLSWRSIEAIKHHLQYLVMLRLNRCYSIPTENYPDLACMPFLQALNVFGIMGRGFLAQLKQDLPRLMINVEPLTTIARPTTGLHRTSIWEERMREDFMY